MYLGALDWKINTRLPLLLVASNYKNLKSELCTYIRIRILNSDPPLIFISMRPTNITQGNCTLLKNLIFTVPYSAIFSGSRLELDVAWYLWYLNEQFRSGLEPSC
jgi:hypothetical protein